MYISTPVVLDRDRAAMLLIHLEFKLKNFDDVDVLLPTLSETKALRMFAPLIQGGIVDTPRAFSLPYEDSYWDGITYIVPKGLYKIDELGHQRYLRFFRELNRVLSNRQSEL